MPPAPDGADCSDARGMPPDDATAGAAGVLCTAGFAAAVLVLLCRTGVLEAQPIKGTDKKLAAVSPKPCCKKSLRDAIAYS